MPSSDPEPAPVPQGTPPAGDDFPVTKDDPPPVADPPGPPESGEVLAGDTRLTRFPAGPWPEQPLQRRGVPGYEILAELGRGGMGIVYKARHIGLKRTVALKMILAGAHANRSHLERFRTEGEAVARLQHPNIVQIYDIGQHDGLPYFSLEYCEGGTLAEKLNGTPLPPRFAADLTYALAEAMHYAHERQIIHRDLKPANVLLSGAWPVISGEWGVARGENRDPNEDATRTGRDQDKASTAKGRAEASRHAPLATRHSCVPKITDFGLAKKLDEGGMTLDGAIMGTPSYMAPEQAEGRVRDIGPLTDVYALGAMLYEFLTGRPPFRAATAHDTMLQVLREEPVPPRQLNSKVPRDLETITLKCLRKEAAKRYGSAAALAEDLRRFRKGQPIQARPVGIFERSLLWIKRHPSTVAWCGVIVLALAGLITGTVILLNRREAQSLARASELVYKISSAQTDSSQVASLISEMAAYRDWANPLLFRRFSETTPDSKEQLHVRMALAAVSDSQMPYLLELLHDTRRSESARAVVFELLADYFTDRPDELAAIDKDVIDEHHRILLPQLRAQPLAVIAAMKEELARQAPPEPNDDARDRLARRQARSAVTLLQLGEADLVWPLLRHGPDPSRRTYLLHDLGRRGVESDVVIQRLMEESDVSARRALILSLGEFTGDQIAADQRQRVVAQLLNWYRDDRDPGVHSAVDWLLRQGKVGEAPRNLDWQQRSAIERIDREVASPSPSDRHWYVTVKEGLTMAVVETPQEFTMGTPFYKPEDKNLNEYPHRVLVPRSFAIATREVTVGQFHRFLKDNPKVLAGFDYQKPHSPVDDGPIIGVTWFQAAQYCNWLSKQEGIAKSEWCYPDDEVLGYGMVMPKDYLHRTGYRLSTEAEWEYACRAGATTARFFGNSEEMLKEYAWYSKSSNTRTFPVGQLKPNDLGLFDINGNAMEWCQDEGGPYEAADGRVRLDTEDADLQITKGNTRVLRGGSFFYLGRSVRSAFRDYYRPIAGIMYVGLRPARTMR